MSGPFDEFLAFPQGLDVLPDPLLVDWQAMYRGEVAAVVSVVEAWRVAAENGSITGPVLPYDCFDARLDGKWVSVFHVDRYTFSDGRQVHEKAAGYSWRPQTPISE